MPLSFYRADGKRKDSEVKNFYVVKKIPYCLQTFPFEGNFFFSGMVRV